MNRGGGHGGPMGGGPGGPMGGPMGGRDRIFEKLAAVQGPTFELPPLDSTAEKKFNGRARLYVGNLAPEVTEEQLKEILGQYGPVGESFFNGDKHFAFMRMETRADAEKAKKELDGREQNGRPMRVRFAPHQGAVRVSNLGSVPNSPISHLNLSFSAAICHNCRALYHFISICITIFNLDAFKMGNDSPHLSAIYDFAFQFAN